MNQSQCKLEVATMVGPLQVYESIGHWNTAVLVILSLHLLPVWAVATTFLSRSGFSSHQRYAEIMCLNYLNFCNIFYEIMS